MGKAFENNLTFTFQTGVSRLEVGLEITGTGVRAREQRLQINDVAASPAGTFRRQELGDVSSAADVTVVDAHAAVELHSAVGGALDEDDFVGGTLQM